MTSFEFIVLTLTYTPFFAIDALRRHLRATQRPMLIHRLAFALWAGAALAITWLLFKRAAGI